MRSDRLKYGLLAILIIVAAIIWARNLGLFSDGQQYYQVRNGSKEKPKSYTHKELNIEYKKPQTNPFAKPQAASEEKKSVPQKDKKPVVKAPTPISSQYQIDGIVVEKGSPQAILKQSGGRSILITTSDTLNGWIVSDIYEEMIVFSQNNYRDTLFLPKN